MGGGVRAAAGACGVSEAVDRADTGEAVPDAMRKPPYRPGITIAPRESALLGRPDLGVSRAGVARPDEGVVRGTSPQRASDEGESARHSPEGPRHSRPRCLPRPLGETR